MIGDFKTQDSYDGAAKGRNTNVDSTNADIQQTIGNAARTGTGPAGW